MSSYTEQDELDELWSAWEDAQRRADTVTKMCDNFRSWYRSKSTADRQENLLWFGGILCVLIGYLEFALVVFDCWLGWFGLLDSSKGLYIAFGIMSYMIGNLMCNMGLKRQRDRVLFGADIVAAIETSGLTDAYIDMKRKYGD